MARPTDNSKRWALALILIAIALFAIDTVRVQQHGPDMSHDQRLP